MHLYYITSQLEKQSKSKAFTHTISSDLFKKVYSQDAHFCPIEAQAAYRN